MNIIANIYYMTWFVWPVLFIFGLAHGIKSLIKNEEVCNIGLVSASVALVFILAGLMYVSLA